MRLGTSTTPHFRGRDDRCAVSLVSGLRWWALDLSFVKICFSLAVSRWSLMALVTVRTSCCLKLSIPRFQQPLMVLAQIRYFTVGYKIVISNLGTSFIYFSWYCPLRKTSPSSSGDELYLLLEGSIYKCLTCSLELPIVNIRSWCNNHL